MQNTNFEVSRTSIAAYNNNIRMTREDANRKQSALESLIDLPIGPVVASDMKSNMPEGTRHLLRSVILLPSD